jgi:hypothetical protein
MIRRLVAADALTTDRGVATDYSLRPTHLALRHAAAVAARDTDVLTTGTLVARSSFGAASPGTSVVRKNTKQANNKMQRTSHGSNGGSPLILVFGGRR